jgi:hypothetical protein
VASVPWQSCRKETKLEGLSVSSIEDLMPLQFGSGTPYGAVHEGEVYFVTTNRPGSQAANLAFEVGTIDADGSITINVGVFSYLIVPNTGNLQVSMPATYQAGIALVKGNPIKCKQVTGPTCGHSSPRQPKIPAPVVRKMKL